jgi:hypothetical protein
MSENKEISELNTKYKEKMITEFTKFLDVYNSLANTNYVIDIKGEYNQFIRFIGNYIYKDFDQNNWDITSIKISEDVVINLYLFKDTKYYDSVKNFLLSLKHAFFNSLDEDIYNYLNNTKDYNNEEKVICKEFYDRVSALNNAMKNSTFSSLDKDVLSNENISTYSKELKEFNLYSHYISSKPQLYNLIKHFDQKIREISKNKIYPEILFNV